MAKQLLTFVAVYTVITTIADVSVKGQSVLSKLSGL